MKFKLVFGFSQSRCFHSHHVLAHSLARGAGQPVPPPLPDFGRCVVHVWQRVQAAHWILPAFSVSDVSVADDLHCDYFGVQNLAVPVNAVGASAVPSARRSSRGRARARGCLRFFFWPRTPSTRASPRPFSACSSAGTSRGSGTSRRSFKSSALRSWWGYAGFASLGILAYVIGDTLCVVLRASSKQTLPV